MKNLNTIWKKIISNCHITNREIAEEVKTISFMQSNFQCFKYETNGSNIIPKLFNLQQKFYHKEIFKEIINTVTNDLRSYQQIITGNKSWIYDSVIETKAQSFLDAPRWAKTEKSTTNTIKCWRSTYSFLQ